MDFSGKKAALHTLGCKVNSYESDAMIAALQSAGFSIVPFEERADVYVINTCSVTNIADRKSRQMLSRARKLNPDAVICAAGCYVQTAVEKTGKALDADILLGNSRKNALIAELKKYFSARRTEAVRQEQDAAELPSDGTGSEGRSEAAGSAYLKKMSQICITDVLHERVYEDMQLSRIEGHTRAYIKVQDGCNMFCSYCIIPFARGRIRSRRKDDIVRELIGLAQNGVKEIVLTGIHLSSYGMDLWNGYGLADLIETCAEIDGIERIRLGSLEPTIITGEFADRISRISKLCPHFHLSLQSGSDSVLRRMNRHYTTAEYRRCVEILRSRFDLPAITTDVIVGFPGETEDEFQETFRFLESIMLYETHIFRYSMRAGTKAASMTGQIPEKVKMQRLDILEELNRKNKEAFEALWEGKEAEMLLEETDHIDKNEYNVYSTGYTREYIRVFLITEDSDSESEKKGSGMKGSGHHKTDQMECAQIGCTLKGRIRIRDGVCWFDR